MKWQKLTFNLILVHRFHLFTLLLATMRRIFSVTALVYLSFISVAIGQDAISNENFLWKSNQNGQKNTQWKQNGNNQDGQKNNQNQGPKKPGNGGPKPNQGPNKAAKNKQNPAAPKTNQGRNNAAKNSGGIKQNPAASVTRRLLYPEEELWRPSTLDSFWRCSGPGRLEAEEVSKVDESIKPVASKNEPPSEEGETQLVSSKQENTDSNSLTIVLSVVGSLAFVAVCVIAVLLHRKRQYKPSAGHLDLFEMPFFDA